MPRILVVDDHEQNCYYLETLLGSHGYRTTTAPHGAEAMELARVQDFDLCLSDILMPVMDGFALCRAWKLDPRLRAIPFVFYTATYTEPSEERFAMSLGADRFLLKPQPPEVLLEVLGDLLARAPGRPVPPVDEADFLQQHHLTLCQKLEKKLADIERLEAANARFGKILAASLQEIFVFDGATLRFSYVNQGGLDRLGYQESEMKALTPQDMCPEFTDARFRALLQPLREGLQEKAVFETWHRRKDGSTYPVEVHLEPILDGQELSFLAFVQDITARRRAEQEHRRLEAEVHHTQKLESLGRMASSVAHDMNNLLGAIHGLSSTLQERYGEDAHLQRKLGTILLAAEQGRDLVQDLTEFARKDIREKREVDLNRLVVDELEMLRPSADPRVRFEMDRMEGLPKVSGDASALGRVLLNLCRNALDAMPGGGLLKVGTRATEAGWVELRVEDTGTGLPAELLPRILEPFFTTKARGKGTGLGLAIVSSVVRSHGGKVEIQSQEGSGTQVQVLLPAR